MKLPLTNAGGTAVKCRHCGSSNVRVSTHSSGSASHVTYRCKDCRHHFRIHTSHPLAQKRLAKAAFLALVLISLGAFLYLAIRDEGSDVPGTVEYQPTVDMHDKDVLARARQSAESGNAQAQYDLGWAHWQRGEYQQALPWIKAAAAQGHGEAEFRLGMAYLEGLGTVQDYRAALEYLGKAAHHAHLEAQYRLGLFYRDGLAALPDKGSAYVWLNIAAARGHDDALQYRDKLVATMTGEEVRRAQEASAQTLARLNAASP